MSLKVNWRNPYKDAKGEWIKGNLHAHTSEGSQCGHVKIKNLIKFYREADYKFISISDHMTLTQYNAKGIILIPGFEWNSDMGEHTGVYSLDKRVLEIAVNIDRQNELLYYLHDKDALVILNHPEWQETPHYRRESLVNLKERYDGIEIYNAVIERLPGESLATGKWDYLLSSGKRILGFASDDSHIKGDVSKAWICVKVRKITPYAIFNALKRGHFYCSTGVSIIDIQKNRNIIDMETENGQEIHVVTTRGIIASRVKDRGIKVNIKKFLRSENDYVRFTVFGHGASMAWTQPFFAK